MAGDGGCGPPVAAVLQEGPVGGTGGGYCGGDCGQDQQAVTGHVEGSGRQVTAELARA